MILILWFKIILKVILISDHFLWFDFGHDFNQLNSHDFDFDLKSSQIWFYPTLHTTLFTIQAATKKLTEQLYRKKEKTDKSVIHSILTIFTETQDYV